MPEDIIASCLVLLVRNGLFMLFVQRKEDYLSIITAYLPDLHQWEDNFRKRKKK